MKWIVGLGNPGKTYEQTRHNIGFLVIDELARRWGITVNQQQCRALVGMGRVQGEKIFLLKPQTYMNLSGESLRAFADYYKANVADLLVIYDDLDTSFGQIRLRYQGSAGGHNGIKSIIAHIGTQQFNRIRIGIDRPPAGGNIADYVLTTFPKSAQDTLQQVIQLAADASERTLQTHFEKVMAQYNG